MEDTSKEHVAAGQGKAVWNDITKKNRIGVEEGKGEGDLRIVAAEPKRDEDEDDDESDDFCSMAPKPCSEASGSAARGSGGGV